MIDSINSLPMVRNISMPNGLNTNPIQQPQQNGQISNNSNLNGMNALASYNAPSISRPVAKNVQPLLPTILQPEAIKTIQGEKIYNSMGELDSIIKKTNDGTVVYKMEVQAPNDAINKIETYDAQGRLVQVQENLNIIEKGKLPRIPLIQLVKYSPETGKILNETAYQDGKPFMVIEKEYEPNGTVKEYIVNLKEKTSSIVETNEAQNMGRKIDFDKNGNITSIVTKDENQHSKEKLQFINGVVASRSVETKSPVPNLTNKNPMADKDLVPAQAYVLGYDPKQVQGEKVYFSNGALEAISTMTESGGIVVHRFDLNGNLAAILDQTDLDKPKTITFNQDNQSISERLADGSEKLTVISKDGSKDVTVMNYKTDFEKHVAYTKEGLPKIYYERSDGKNEMLMEFDKQGNIIKLV